MHMHVPQLNLQCRDHCRVWGRATRGLASARAPVSVPAVHPLAPARWHQTRRGYGQEVARGWLPFSVGGWCTMRAGGTQLASVHLDTRAPAISTAGAA